MPTVVENANLTLQGPYGRGGVEGVFGDDQLLERPSPEPFGRIQDSSQMVEKPDLSRHPAPPVVRDLNHGLPNAEPVRLHPGIRIRAG